MSQDTSPEGFEEYHARLRSMTYAKRARTMGTLSRGVRPMALLGLKWRHPQADEPEWRVRLVVRLDGRILRRGSTERCGRRRMSTVEDA